MGLVYPGTGLVYPGMDLVYPGIGLVYPGIGLVSPGIFSGIVYPRVCGSKGGSRTSLFSGRPFYQPTYCTAYNVKLIYYTACDIKLIHCTA